MDNQPQVVSPVPAPMPPAPRRSSLSTLLLIVLAIGTLGFGLASIIAFSQAHTAKTTLSSAKASAAKAAAEQQAAADKKAADLANASPYRTYTAPKEYGAFVLSFPKNWNISVDIENKQLAQLTIALQPDVLRTVDGTDDLLATKVTVLNETTDAYLATFKKVPKVTQKSVVISGIAATELGGNLPNLRDTRLVAVPVRDKTIVFDNEDDAYASVFDTILTQAKINP